MCIYNGEQLDSRLRGNDRLKVCRSSGLPLDYFLPQMFQCAVYVLVHRIVCQERIPDSEKDRSAGHIRLRRTRPAGTWSCRKAAAKPKYAIAIPSSKTCHRESLNPNPSSRDRLGGRGDLLAIIPRQILPCAVYVLMHRVSCGGKNPFRPHKLSRKDS